MSEMRDLIGAQRAAAAGVVGPAENARFEEGAIDDQLTAALEEVKQAELAIGSLELIFFLDRHPRHPPAFGSEGVTGAGEGFLLCEELLVCGFPLFLRHDRRCVHREMFFLRFLSTFFSCCHVASPLFYEIDRDDSC